MKIKRFYKKFLSLFCAVFIFSSTMVTSFYIRPLEVYAASVALEFGEGFLSLVCDVLFSFGCKFSGYAQAVSTVVSFTNFYEKRRVEILDEYAENPDALKEQLRFGYKAKEDTRDKEVVITKEKMVSAADWADTHKTADKIDSLSDLPEEFIQTAQAFAISQLNISSVDGKVLKPEIFVSQLDFLYTQKQLNKYKYYDGYTLNISGSMWVTRYFYLAIPGTSLTITRETTGEITSFSFTEDTCTILKNGIAYYEHDLLATALSVSSATLKRLLGCYGGVIGIPEVPIVGYPSTYYDYKSDYIGIKTSYSSSPSVDVAYANAGAVSWNGTADLTATIENQNSVSSIDEYIGKTLTATGDIVVPTEAPSESETEGSSEGEADATLSGIIGWLSKIYNSILSLPDKILSSLDLVSLFQTISMPLANILSYASSISDKIADIANWDINAWIGALASPLSHLVDIDNILSDISLWDIDALIDSVPKFLNIDSVLSDVSAMLSSWNFADWPMSMAQTLKDVLSTPLSALQSSSDAIAKALDNVATWDLKTALKVLENAITDALTGALTVAGIASIIDLLTNIKDIVVGAIAGSDENNYDSDTDNNFFDFVKLFYILIAIIILLIILFLNCLRFIVLIFSIPASTSFLNNDILLGIDYVKNLQIEKFNLSLYDIIVGVVYFLLFLAIIKAIRNKIDRMHL